METHGNSPEKNVIAIVPARLESVRLRHKLLLDVAGKPLIVRTLERASRAEAVDEVVAAVDSEELRSAVEGFGFKAVMTSPDHQSGSDRIAEAARSLGPYSIVVNVQGDEPVISPKVIDSVVRALRSDRNAAIATSCEEIGSADDATDPNVVKVVFDGSGRALYFSRSPIPYPRDAANRHGGLRAALAAEPALLGNFRKHTGLYAYRSEALERFCSLPRSANEMAESLEQLRALENGMKIVVVESSERSIGVDTEADLAAVRELIANGKAAYERFGS